MDRISTATTSTTAWWGFCYECRLYFGNHSLGCSHIATRLPDDGVTSSGYLFGRASFDDPAR